MSPRTGKRVVAVVAIVGLSLFAAFAPPGMAVAFLLLAIAIALLIVRDPP